MSATTKSHWDAELYQKTAKTFQVKHALLWLEQLPLKDEDTILDIGCGDGQVTRNLARIAKNGYVDGIDISSSMIATAKKTCHLSNLNFYVHDIEQASWTKKYDVLVSFFCIQWLSDKAKFFQNISKQLNKKGKIAFLFTNRNLSLLEARKQLIQKDNWAPFFKHYNDSTHVLDFNDYIGAAKSANLSNIQLTKKMVSHDCSSRFEFEQFLQLISPALSYVKPELHEQFMGELADIYLNENGHTKYSIDYNFYYMTASL
ncbi:MAG: methyltransferase domain-containing protein [Shewanellaceae bacterium]|nr:methyltransferase domain-containing protein [Shewanellaceae bacterium]